MLFAFTLSIVEGFLQDERLGPLLKEPPSCPEHRQRVYPEHMRRASHPPRGGSFLFVLRDLLQRHRDTESQSLGCPSRVFVLLCALCASAVMPFVLAPCCAQTSKPAAPRNPLQQHYEAAQTFQAAGNLQAAAVEYRQFLAAALDGVAIARASIGDYAKALPLFDEAVNLVPSDVDLRVDYADACRRAGDLQKAKSLADAAIEAEPRNAKAHISLGRTLQRLNAGPDVSAADKQAAIEQFEDAVAAEPNFEHGLALAGAYLWAKDEPNATRVFTEMVKSFGASPEILIQIGTAYAQAGYPEQAITEFKKVIARNPKFPGAHYSLGAAYLVSASDALYPQAAEEFRKELEINPDDYLSRYQLGYIELSQHKLPEAEKDLTRAAALDPKNPDAFLSLVQHYVETNPPADAEAALRKAIALTTDVSRNNFQVQRAHYLLAR